MIALKRHLPSLYLILLFYVLKHKKGLKTLVKKKKIIFKM